MNFEIDWTMDGKPVYTTDTQPPEHWTIYWRDGTRELVSVPCDLLHIGENRAVFSSVRNPCLPENARAHFEDDEYWNYYQKCQQSIFEIRRGDDNSWRWQEDEQEWIPS